MNNVAFDLDGVLVPDFDTIPDLGDIHAFYQMSHYIKPIFNPQSEYGIITGRFVKHRHYTEQWIKKYLTPAPSFLFHNRDQESPEKYKADILNRETYITQYIESDLKIVEYLKRHVRPNCSIIHFADFLSSSFVSN
jgi:hypothetical protein